MRLRPWEGALAIHGPMKQRNKLAPEVAYAKREGEKDASSF